GGKKLLDGSMGNTSFQIGSNANETVSFGLSDVSASALRGSYSAATAEGGVNGLGASIVSNVIVGGGEAAIPAGTVTAFEASVDGSITVAPTGFDGVAGGDIALSSGSITVAAGSSLQDVADAISADAAAITAGYSADVDDGNLVISREGNNVSGVDLSAVGLGTPADSANYVAATSGSVTTGGTFQAVTGTETVDVTVGGTAVTLNATDGASAAAVASAITS